MQGSTVYTIFLNALVVIKCVNVQEDNGIYYHFYPQKEVNNTLCTAHNNKNK